MKQIDLFTKKVEKKFEFIVCLYVPGKGDITTHITTTKDDKRDAIQRAKKKLKIDYYQQALAKRIFSQPKDSP